MVLPVSTSPLSIASMPSRKKHLGELLVGFDPALNQFFERFCFRHCSSLLALSGMTTGNAGWSMMQVIVSASNRISIYRVHWTAPQARHGNFCELRDEPEIASARNLRVEIILRLVTEPLRGTRHVPVHVAVGRHAVDHDARRRPGPQLAVTAARKSPARSAFDSHIFRNHLRSRRDFPSFASGMPPMTDPA